MKKLLEKQIVFNLVLKVLAFFAQSKHFDSITQWATNLTAKLNVHLNKPTATEDISALAQEWKAMMPADGQDNFKLGEVTADTAYTQIHLHCPLRGTGNVEACYKLMNYDRQLMAAIGGELIVLESQSNSGKNYCQLAIRRKGDDTSDLTPAHHKQKSD